MTDLSKKQKYIALWAAGLLYLILSFAGLVALDAYHVAHEFKSHVMWLHILLGFLVSQPALYAYWRLRRGKTTSKWIDTVLQGTGAVIIVSVPFWSIISVETALWVDAFTLATGVFVVRFARKTVRGG